MNIIKLTISSILISCLFSIFSFAGEWQHTQTPEIDSWQYIKDDGSYAISEYINHNEIWYYLDGFGNLLMNSTTPDGLYYCGPDGTRNDDTKIDENEMKEKSMNTGVLIFNKTSHWLQFWKNGNKIYQCVAVAGNNLNDKNMEGDWATPEGEFYVCLKNSNSAYYKAIGVSYPNIEDAERGLQTGLINQKQFNQIVNANNSKSQPLWNTNLGGFIEIHGQVNRNLKDATRGCISITNTDIDNIWNHVSLGDKIYIVK